MYDLSKQKTTVACPKCKRVHSATFQDVIIRKTFKCQCGATLNLEDKNGSVKKAVNDINKEFKNLENTLKKFLK